MQYKIPLIKSLLPAGLLFLNTLIFGQISQPATPPSFELINLKEEVQAIRMEKVDVERLLQEDQIFDSIKDIPWRFGENLYVNINPQNSGHWDILENGDKIWRVSIHSEGAYTINLTFDQYRLPPGAQLFVYNKDQSSILGAFTDFNNQEDGYFATTLIEGDYITIEYFEPKNASFPGELNLQMVTHAYRDPFKFAKGFGDSGWCNLNVACPEAEGWEEQIRSVVMLVSGGNGFCSGVIINNTEFDQKPLVLSANHCFRNPATVVFWFNWQSETCDNPTSSPPYNSMSGATQRARHSSSDFWLMELNQAIPDDYNPYYAGWNRTSEALLNETIIGIHHPRGDIKKFSYATGGVQAAAYGGSPGSGTTHWRIVWSGGTTTEPGSSGSPIFDANGRILGQLHGGGAACGNTLPDWYGRFGISWVGGGTQATRLSDWLDPLGTDLMAINGLDPFAPGVLNPMDFVAEANSENEILLQWQLNVQEDFVMVAVNDEPVFGQPEGSYALGEEITGGGTVIYMGNDEDFLHIDLQPFTDYHYAIWSYAKPGPVYSEGLTSSATTFCSEVVQFPYFEGFNNSDISICWTQEYVVNELDWMIGVGNNDGYPVSAWEGESNVFFRTTVISEEGSTTRLISPEMNLSLHDHAQLSFYYANPSFVGRQDILRIYYRTEPSQEWQILEILDFNQFTWANVTLDLPELSDRIQIAFEGQANRGRGISLDQVEVFAGFEQQIPNPVNLSFNIVEDNFAELNWEIIFEDEKRLGIPKQSSEAGINIYRDGALIFAGSDVNQTSFTDGPLAVGDYTYYVAGRQVNGELSEPSNEVNVNIPAQGNEHLLSISKTGQGNISIPEGEYQYKPGTTLELEAIPDENWTLQQWVINGVESGSSQSIMITLDMDKEVEVIFIADTWEITVNASPEDAAETLEGAGIYEHGEMVTLSVIPNTGYIFLHWLDDNKIISTKETTQIIVNSDKDFTAVLEPRDFTVDVKIKPEGSGTVAGAGTFGAGEEIVLTATPEPGWLFKNWTIVANSGESEVSTDTVYTFTLKNNIELTANFEAFSPTLTVSIEGQGTTDPEPGEYSFDYGHELTLNASGIDPWVFSKWIINGNDFMDEQISLNITENTDAIAVFAETTHTDNFAFIEEPNLYPNPASGRLNIVLPEDGSWQIQIFDITGQLVESRMMEFLAGTPVTLDISSLRSGVYIFRIQNEGKVFNRRILVE